MVAPGRSERPDDGSSTPPLVPPADHLDRLIHERLRLGIISALTATPVLSFTDLKKLLKTTDGNLSVHARKLEEAGYIACLKSFDGRTPAHRVPAHAGRQGRAPALPGSHGCAHSGDQEIDDCRLTIDDYVRGSIIGLRRSAFGNPQSQSAVCIFPTSTTPHPSTASVNDAELVERARAGDHAAFGILVDRYQHVVVRAVRAVVGPGEEVEDVAQDVFLRAWRRIGGFRGEASVKTWLLAIAWRQALSHRRSIAARLRRFIAPGDDAAFDPPATARLQDQAVADMELRRAVARVVARRCRRSTGRR